MNDKELVSKVTSCANYSPSLCTYPIADNNHKNSSVSVIESLSTSIDWTKQIFMDFKGNDVIVPRTMASKQKKPLKLISNAVRLLRKK